MSQRQEGTAQSVQVRDSGGIGVLLRLFRRVLLLRAFGSCNALLVPCLPVIGLRLEIFRHVALDILVRTRVAGFITVRGNGVVHVVGYLLPGIEHDLFMGVIGMERCNDAVNRIIKQNGTDADFLPNWNW